MRKYCTKALCIMLFLMLSLTGCSVTVQEASDSIQPAADTAGAETESETGNKKPLKTPENINEPYMTVDDNVPAGRLYPADIAALFHRHQIRADTGICRAASAERIQLRIILK